MIDEIMLSEFNRRKENYKIKVILTYFKESGKFYDEYVYMEDYLPLYKIWEKIENMDVSPGHTCK